MPQYIPQQQQSNALTQMQSQIGQQQMQGLERARLTAGQYMKDFRADAEKAGYSLSEWAKLNEQNVKSALFALSGSNQNVTEQKYQELISGPENFDQKGQRLRDDLSAQGPNNLLGTPDETITAKREVTPATTTITTELTGGIEPEVFFEAAKKYEGDDLNGLYTSIVKKAPGEGYFDWRKKMFELYNLTPENGEYRGTEPENKALMNAFKTKGYEYFTEKIVRGGPNIEPKYLEALEKVNLPDKPYNDPSLTNSAPISDRQANPSILTGDPKIREGYKQTAERLLLENPGAFNGYFARWTSDQVKELLSNGEMATVNTENIDAAIALLPVERQIKTENPAVYEEYQKIIKKGDEGFARYVDRISKEILKEGDTFGAVPEKMIKLAVEGKEAEVLKARTDAERNMASSQLMQVQAAQMLSQLNNSTDPRAEELRKQFYDTLERYEKYLNENDISKMKEGDSVYLGYNALTSSLKTYAMATGAILGPTEVDYGKNLFGWGGSKTEVFDLLSFTNGQTGGVGIDPNVSGNILSGTTN